MASLVGVGSKTEAGKNVGKSKGGKDKGVESEGSSFWMKLWMLFACMAWRSKAEHRSSGDTNNNNKQDKGKKPIRDNGKAPVVVEASSSNNNNQGTSGSTPQLIMELQYHSNLRQFTFHELKLATENFKAGNFLGEGGFGTVHKGWIIQNDCSPSKPGVGIPVAVKTLNKEGNQSRKEWVIEVSNLGALEHPNLVKLVGYCIERDNRVLVYEFMPRGSLEHHLFRRGAFPLPWSIRLKILIGAAKGLTFLHGEATKPLIYRDFKTSNILLDSDYSAKLSDFGLVKDAPMADLTHVSTRLMGTQGYAAPEYVMIGHLSSNSDVYSFGVVLLEVMTGRRVMDKKRPVAEHHLVEWARPQIKPGSGAQYHQVMDPNLDGHYSTKGARRAMRLAYHCLSRDPKLRPLMSQVVEGLHCASQYTDLACASPFYHHIMKQGQGQGAPSSSNSKPASANNIATNKYGLIIGPSTGSTPSRFQASPLSFTHPFPSPQPSAGAG